MAVAFCLALLACGRGGPDWRILQLYSGETSVDLLQHPSKVQAFRVDPSARKPAVAEVHAGPYVAAGAVVDVPADAAAELSAIFADAASYDWRRGPKPIRPQIGLHFVRGAYVLELALDLDAGEVGVHAGGQPLGPPTSVDPSRARLVAVAKRLFPDDAVVRALK